MTSYMNAGSVHMAPQREMAMAPDSMQYAKKAHVLVKQTLREVRIPPQNAGPFPGSGGYLSFIINDKNFILPEMAIDWTITAAGTSGTRGDNYIRLDQSSHSLIRQLEVYSNGTLIEKIDEYSSLMAMIGDMHIPASKRRSLQPTQQFAACDDVSLESDAGRVGNTSEDVNNYANSFRQVGVITGVTGTNVTAVNVQKLVTGAMLSSKQYGDFSMGGMSNWAAADALPAGPIPSASTTERVVPLRFGGRGDMGAGCDEVILHSGSGTDGVDGSSEPVVLNGMDIMNRARVGEYAPRNMPIIDATYSKRSIRCITPLSLSSVCGVMAVDGKAWPGFAFCPLEVRVYLDQHAFVGFNAASKREYKVESDAQLIYKAIEVDPMLSAEIQDYAKTSGLSIHVLQYNNLIIQPQVGSQSADIPITKFFQSLRSVLFGFFPQGYASCPTQRKFSRVSNCLTELQLQCGSVMMPCAPIRGNSGNSHVYLPVTNLGRDPQNTRDTASSTIAPFLHELYSSYSNFSTLAMEGILTATNCCYNGVPVYYTLQASEAGLFVNGSNPFMCGRMCYAIDTSTSSDNPTITTDNTITGLDTTSGNNPVILKYKSASPYTGRTTSVPAGASIDTNNGLMDMRVYQLYDAVIYCNPMRQIGINM